MASFGKWGCSENLGDVQFRGRSILGKSKMAQNRHFHTTGGVENNVGRRENAGSQHFLLFLKVLFQTASFSMSLFSKLLLWESSQWVWKNILPSKD